jgi:hypothetical protein
MPRIEAQVEIAASPSSVFRFCHDVTRRPDWDERMVGVELLTPEPVRRGTLIRVDAGRGGRYLYSWDGEYAEFQFPVGSSLRVIDAAPSSPFRSGTERWDFSSIGGGTRLRLVWEYQPRGLIARVSDFLGGRSSTHRALRRSLVNLKALIESTPTP